MKKNINELPSSEFLHELLSYDAVTGKIYWKPRGLHHFKNVVEYNKWNMRYADKEAGFNDRIRNYPVYRSISFTTKDVKTKKYGEHRIIYKMVYGVDPIYIDHINGIPDDNRIENLQSVTNQENSMNRPMYKNNKSGYIGVYYIESTDKWYGSYAGHKKGFKTKEEAIEYTAELHRIYGVHPNHGRKSLLTNS